MTVGIDEVDEWVGSKHEGSGSSSRPRRVVVFSDLVRGSGEPCFYKKTNRPVLGFRHV